MTAASTPDGRDTAGTATSGDSRVDAATARLEELADLPVADHVAVFDGVHRSLQDTLTSIDGS